MNLTKKTIRKKQVFMTISCRQGFAIQISMLSGKKSQYKKVVFISCFKEFIIIPGGGARHAPRRGARRGRGGRSGGPPAARPHGVPLTDGAGAGGPAPPPQCAPARFQAIRWVYPWPETTHPFFPCLRYRATILYMQLRASLWIVWYNKSFFNIV